MGIHSIHTPTMPDTPVSTYTTVTELPIDTEDMLADTTEPPATTVESLTDFTDMPVDTPELPTVTTGCTVTAAEVVSLRKV